MKPLLIRFTDDIDLGPCAARLLACVHCSGNLLAWWSSDILGPVCQDIRHAGSILVTVSCLQVTNVEEEEYCLIPMGGALPLHPQRVLAIGGSAGMVHPSTGFMMSRMLGSVPTVADAIVDQLSKPADKAASSGEGVHAMRVAVLFVGGHVGFVHGGDTVCVCGCVSSLASPHVCMCASPHVCACALMWRQRGMHASAFARFCPSKA